MAELQPLAFERAGIRILPSGRAVIGGGARTVIEAVRAGPLHIEGPNVKRNVNPLMEEWRENGTFDAPRLKTLQGGGR